MRAKDMSRHARQVMTVIEGKARAGAPGADPSIARSWLRCLEQYHLDPAQNIAPTVLEHARMLERREQSRQVLEIAAGEMHSLHQQLSGAGHAVLLTDARGIILNCISEDAERRAFERAGLWLGADWSEDREGTNGIGTCLVERQALTIHQQEHFRSRHTGLTCSASPVFDPQGELLAVLDVSSARPSVTRQSQFHTMALVSLSAKSIESCYFLRHFEDHWLLRFHLRPDGHGLFSEGMMAFDGDGRILAVNQSAISLLGAPRETLLGRSLEDFFACRLDELFARADPQPTASWPLLSPLGRVFYALLRGPRPRPSRLSSVVKAPLVKGLCIDDPQLARDFQRALKVYAHDVPLLLQGETGTGKEAFARAVHQASERASRAFVALNCAAIPESLIESELFGYRGGSFTGARREGMRGKLQQADGGTLFLDEIGDMPLALQTRLLRVLEERQVVPIGGEPQAVDIRLISASHRDLTRLVAAGLFREDLYYRLNGLVVQLPPLRARQDRSTLLDHLLNEERKGRTVHLESPLRQWLLDYSWPGNVRQLRNLLRTLCALCEDGWIRLTDLPADLYQPKAAPLKQTTDNQLSNAERQALLDVLEAQSWHVSRAAQQLGISRNTLYRKLHKHGLARGN